MGAGPLPTTKEMLAWMAEHGAEANDAVKHFLPELDEDAARRKGANLRIAAYRARKAGKANAPQVARGGSEPQTEEQRPEPDLERAKLRKVDFLEWQLAELLADLEHVRKVGLIREVSKLDARVSSVRSDLDAARAEAGQAVSLERDPAVVAKEIKRRQRQIAALAAKAGERNL